MTKWLNQLPESGKDRDNMILQAISDGNVVCDWISIQSDYQGHTGTFWLNSDACHVILDDGSRFRFMVSASLAQRCADALEAMLPTTKLMDLRHSQAINKLNATLLTAGPQMSSKQYSIDWNVKLENKRNGDEGIISDCGKPWIIDNALGASQGACLYGFYDVKAPFTNSVGMKMWQLVGTRHNEFHFDYSSTLLLMDKNCEIDGQTVSIEDVAKDPVLSNLMNYGGKLNFVRGKV